jgi:two-component system sensor histidine kinase GlrK
MRIHSIPGLILLAFGLAIIPLVAALVTATFYVDRVTVQGQRAIAEATRSANATQKLAEAVTAMERSARQYNILGEKDFYRLYLSWREDYRTSLANLMALDLNRDLAASLRALSDQERQLQRELEQTPPESQAMSDVLSRFGDLVARARTIESQSGGLVREATGQLRDSARRAKDILAWQTVALVPLVLLVTGMLIVTVIRPMRHLNGAIRRLGRGDFEQPVVVRGTRDLEDLGHNLDRMRRLILELEGQKVTFLRHMSHELKTPLASIREGSELLAEELVGTLNGEQREIAGLLRENSLRLQYQIEDLLQFNLARDRQETLHLSRIDLHDKLGRVLDDHRIRIKSKSLRVTDDLEPVTIVGDGEKLRMVFDNLMSNAVKFSPHGARLTIRLRREGDLARIEVIDEGPGIPADERAKVFEAFFQGANQRTEHVAGTGLGLSIARAYVELHDGRIAIGDTETGTRVIVELPIVQGEKEGR